jgi:predicted RNA-binding Zn-ribbon protein involved in translation (DUF1610 family)
VSEKVETASAIKIVRLLYWLALSILFVCFLGMVLQRGAELFRALTGRIVPSTVESLLVFATVLGPVIWAIFIIIGPGVELTRKLAGYAPVCPSCGYDLQGLVPKVTVCPECGNARIADSRSDKGVKLILERISSVSRKSMGICVFHFVSGMLLLAVPAIPNAVPPPIARWVSTATGSPHNLTALAVSMSLTAYMFAYAAFLHLQQRKFEKLAKAA